MSRRKCEGVNVFLRIFAEIESVHSRSFFPLTTYLLHSRMFGSPYDSHYTYIIQNLVHMSDIREVGQRGNLFVRQRTGNVMVLKIT